MPSPCDTCPHRSASLAAKVEEGMRDGMIDLTGVGTVWDDASVFHGCRAIVYAADGRYATGEAPTPEDAAEQALKQLRGPAVAGGLGT